MMTERMTVHVGDEKSPAAGGRPNVRIILLEEEEEELSVRLFSPSCSSSFLLEKEEEEEEEKGEEFEQASPSSSEMEISEMSQGISSITIFFPILLIIK